MKKREQEMERVVKSHLYNLKKLLSVIKKRKFGTIKNTF